MPTIRIDDEVYESLKKHAEPFEDSPNSVLRRVLGLDKKVVVRATPEIATKGKKRIARGEAMPQGEYRIPILKALVELGGRGTVSEVLNAVFPKVKYKLRPADNELLSSGDIRWEKSANWARYGMVKAGLLADNSERGVWEITEKGRAYLSRNAPIGRVPGH